MKKPKTLGRLRLLSCDGNRIGKTWEEHFYADLNTATTAMYTAVDKRNENEQKRNRLFALYKPDCVENVEGYCDWQYGLMLAVDQITIDDPNKSPL